MENFKNRRERLVSGLVYSLIGITIYFFSTEFAYDILYLLLKNKKEISNIDSYIVNNYYLFDTIAMIVALSLLLIFVYIRSHIYKKKYRKDYIKNKHISGTEFLKSIVILLGMKGLINLWFIAMDFLARRIPILDYYLNVFQEGAGSPAYNESYIFIFLSVVLIGPIVEELIFRGIIFREMENYRGRLVAIVVSSLAFGIFHGDFIQFFYTSLLGLVFAYIYGVKDSFNQVVALHIINNYIETLPPRIEELAYVYELVNISQYIFIIPGLIILMRSLNRLDKLDSKM